MRLAMCFIVLIASIGAALSGALLLVRAADDSDAVWIAFYADGVFVTTPDGGIVRQLTSEQDASTTQLFWLDAETVGWQTQADGFATFWQAHRSGAGRVQPLDPAQSPFHWAVTSPENFVPDASAAMADVDLGNGVGVLAEFMRNAEGDIQPLVKGSRSPDGTQFAFACVPPQMMGQALDEWGLCVADYTTHTTPGSTNPRWLAQGFFINSRTPLQWSSDGRWVTFEGITFRFQTLSSVPEPDIFRVEVPTGELQRLTDFNDEETNPNLSADDGWVVFSAHLRNDTNLFRVRASGTRLRQMTANAAYDRFPQYSPQGGYVVFISDRTGFVELYRVPVAGFEEDVQQITSLQRDISEPPALSPVVDRDFAGAVLAAGFVLLGLGGVIVLRHRL